MAKQLRPGVLALTLAVPWLAWPSAGHPFSLPKLWIWAGFTALALPTLALSGSEFGVTACVAGRWSGRSTFMWNKRIERLALSFAAFFLSYGLARSVMQAGEQPVSAGSRERSIFAACDAERKRLGLPLETAGSHPNPELYKRYPTPEVRLRSVRVASGATLEIVVPGKFQPGTMYGMAEPGYLSVEVLKESVTSSEFRATIRVPAGIEIGYIPGRIYAPVSCAAAGLTLDVISQEGEFVASLEDAPEPEEGSPPPDKLWRIKLTLKERQQKRENAFYTIQLYREKQTQPFKTGLVEFSMNQPLTGGIRDRLSSGNIAGAILDEEGLGCPQLKLHFKPDGQVNGNMWCGGMGNWLVQGSFTPF